VSCSGPAMRDTGIADRLRAAGLPVVECDGWQTRGSDSFSPAGSVNHHTAGPASGSTPSLGTVINGRPDLSGPLANVLQSREPDGNDIAYVVAAGRANHAGEGGWRGLSGNSSVYGLEIEHTGTEPLPEHRQRRAAAIHAAMFGGDPGMVCQHREWAPERKPDAAEGVDPDTFRTWVAEGGSGAAPTPPPPMEVPGMFLLYEPAGRYWLVGDTTKTQIGGDEWNRMITAQPALPAFALSQGGTEAILRGRTLL
jgi:hypothetical protein